MDYFVFTYHLQSLKITANESLMRERGGGYSYVYTRIFEE